MKTINFISMIMMVIISSEGFCEQGIDSITMIPKNPTINDSITFKIYVAFPSMGCVLQNQNTTITDSTIVHLSQYCYGSFMMVCRDTDIVKLPILPKGHFTFHYVLESALYSKCSPYYPDDSVNYQFNVVQPFGLSENNHITTNLFDLVKNNNLYRINIRDFTKPAFLKIYNLQGQAIFNAILNNKESEINVELDNGIFLFEVACNNRKQTIKIANINSR